MNLKRVYIYDIVLRLSHAGLAFFCIVLLLTAWGADFFAEYGLFRKAFWIAHIFSGYGLILSLAVRVVWGLIGPASAKFKNFWKWEIWKQMIRTRSLKVTWGWGHHPLASISYLAFYLALLFLSVTGIFLAAIEHNQGPLAPEYFDEVLLKPSFSSVHEVLSWFVLFFIMTHLIALVWHEKHDEIPVAQSMVSGFQYRKTERESHDSD